MGVNPGVKMIVRSNKQVVTRKGFVAWLDSKDKTTIVGTSCRSGDCPIAQYVRIKLGVLAVAVTGLGLDASKSKNGELHIYQQNWTERHWLHRYVRAVDAYGYGNQPITAAVARDLLAKV